MMPIMQNALSNLQSRLPAGTLPGSVAPAVAPRPVATGPVSNMTPPQNIFAARAAGAPTSFARLGTMQPNNGARMGGPNMGGPGMGGPQMGAPGVSGPPMSAGPIAIPVRPAPNPVAAGPAPGMPGAPTVPPQAAWPIAQNFLRQRLMGLG